MMHAPQIVLLAMWALETGLVWAKHGEPKTDKYDLSVTLFGIGVVSAILWWGGFWK